MYSMYFLNLKCKNVFESLTVSGGYAGDALPSARLLSHVTDWLVTHPNVMNGATLYWPIKNALYVEVTSSFPEI